MRKTKISTSLEAIVANTLLYLGHEQITTSYSDRLAIELLSDRSTFAYQLLEMLIGESGVNVILRRVEQAITRSPIMEQDSPQNHYESICRSVECLLSTPCISTVHVLYFIVMDTSTATSKELSHYGVISDDVACALRRLSVV